jgi:hypothetical protein
MGALSAPPPFRVRPRWVAFSVAAVMALMTSATSTAARTNVRATLQVCGARACTTLKTTMSRISPTVFGARGSSALPPPARAFYVLKLSVEGAPRVQTGWYVPSSHTTRWLNPRPSRWTKLRRRGAAFLRRHLPAGPPHRAPRPVRVTVAHRLVHDRAPYARVFDHFRRAPILPASAHWIGLRVSWPAGTPWRFEHAGLNVVPSRRVLARPGGWYLIPLEFARVIAKDARR